MGVAMFENTASRNKQRRSAWFIVPIVCLTLMATSLTLACDDGLQHTTSTRVPANSLAPSTTHIPTPTSGPASAATTAAGGLTVQAQLNDGPVRRVDADDRSSAVPPVGSTWVLHSLDGRPVIEGSFVALKVYQDGAGAYGGCNRIGLGPITFPGEPVDKKPYFGPGGVIHHTGSSKNDRGCIGPGGLAEQEEGYWRALIEGNRYRLEDDRLEVFATNGALRLVFYRQEPLPGQQIDLEGTAWRQMGDVDVTLAFLGGLVAGETACRDLLTTYKLSPRLRFPSIGMRGSGESCSEEERASEGITDFLSYVWEYSVYEEAGSRRLGMRSSEGDTRTFAPLPQTIANITDVEWSLTSFVRLGDHFTLRNTGVIPGSKVTISFGDTGFSGNAGCNNYAGLAKLEDGLVTVDVRSIYREEETCEGRGLMEQEARYLGLLPKLTLYGVYGDALYMRTNDDIFLLFGAE